MTGRLQTPVGQRVGGLCPPRGSEAAERQFGKSKVGRRGQSHAAFGVCAGQRMGGHCVGTWLTPGQDNGRNVRRDRNFRGTNF